MEQIFCACGCGQLRDRYDSYNRERKYINGHAMGGKHHTEETKQKIKETKTGNSFSNSGSFQKGRISPNKNTNLTEEIKRKISEALKGKTHSEETKQKMSEARKREKHWNWRGGISSERDVARNLPEYKQWRISVFKRDNFTCQICGCKKSGELQAHHIFKWSEEEDIRYTLWNGITLCKGCHEKTYGKEHHFTSFCLCKTMSKSDYLEAI